MKTIKEIIDAHRWDIDPLLDPDAGIHNEGLDTIEAAVRARIAEFECMIDEIHVTEQGEWYPIETLSEIGVEVLLYNKKWVDEDFTPDGIRVGYRNEGPTGPVISARWNGSHDCWINDDCDMATHWMTKPKPPHQKQGPEQPSDGGEFERVLEQHIKMYTFSSSLSNKLRKAFTADRAADKARITELEAKVKAYRHANGSKAARIQKMKDQYEEDVRNRKWHIAELESDKRELLAHIEKHKVSAADYQIITKYGGEV